jgi:hypothetical protein
MRDERLEVSVKFDSAKGYIASAPELRASVAALSLGGLRRRIEGAWTVSWPSSTRGGLAFAGCWSGGSICSCRKPGGPPGFDKVRKMRTDLLDASSVIMAAAAHFRRFRRD